MNKDFEKAYKELAKIEVPDLWDRIEAGLTEKSAPGEGSVTIDKSNEKERINAEKTSKKPQVILFVKRYSSLAAAVLCAVIIVPALIIMKQAGISKSSSSGSAAAAEEAFDTTESADEAAEQTEEAAQTGAADMETGVSEAETQTCEAAADESWEDDGTEESAAEEKAFDAAGEAENTAGQGNVADAGLNNTERSMADDAQRTDMEADKAAASQEKLQKKESHKPEEGQIITNVIVKVAEVNDYISETQALEEMGTLYTAVVQEDPSGILTEGEQIVIFIPVYSSTALVKGCVFELDLAFSEKENYSFTVERYHEQIEE